jgi:hypothetical protein
MPKPNKDQPIEQGAARRSLSQPPNNQEAKRLSVSWVGIVAVIVALLVTLSVTVHLTFTPVIDWSLPLYLPALVSGWCGEIWLRNGTLRARLRGLAAAALGYKWELAALSLITAGGLAIRLWMAAQYGLQHGTQNDELTVAAFAWQLAHSTSPWPLYVVEHGAAALYQPIALAFLVFGASMESLRISIAVENSLLVPAFYLLARQFSSAPIALCVTALLAFAYWPATLGMMAFGMMLGAIFQSLGLALLLFGYRRRSFTAGAGAGAVLAGCMYCYLGARIMPVAALPVLIHCMIRGSGSVRSRLFFVIIFCFSFSALAMPWLSTVWNERDLIQGDSPGLVYEFSTKFHHDAMSAVHGVWNQAVQLITTIFSAPTAFTYFPVQSGGLLDILTATIGLPAVAYVVLRCGKLDGALIVFAIVPPVIAASIVDPDFLNVYRLGSAVPGFYLALVVLFSRCLQVLKILPGGVRIALSSLILVGCASSIMNVRAIAAHVGNNSYYCGHTDFFSNIRSDDVTVADAVNALGPKHADFVVTHYRGFDEPVAAPWLYHQAPPLMYNARTGSADPVTWQRMAHSPPLPVGPEHAVFWPPRLGTGQIAISYIMFNDDKDVLLPLLFRDYPGGQSRTIGLDSCPTTYSLTVYTLSAGQIDPNFKGSLQSR